MIVRRAAESLLTSAAHVGWAAIQAVNRLKAPRRFQPNWAPRPLLRSEHKTSPALGWPRTTDSLCPDCVREARARILAGLDSHELLRTSRVGEIAARIFEEDGIVRIEKTCETHGTYRDVLSIDPAFLRRIESQFPGRDLEAVTSLHNHGTSSIKYGRGSVLTIDLTNRCNMMCDPCFMDANQVGYVHELTFDEVKKLLDDAASVKPRRQMTVQFSGGEPTLSPHLSRVGGLRAPDRVLRRAGGDQRHPVRAGPRVCGGREGGRPAHRVPPVRRRGRRWPTPTARSGTSST